MLTQETETAMMIINSLNFSRHFPFRLFPRPTRDKKEETAEIQTMMISSSSTSEM